MEWLTEAVDTDARPMPDAVATLVKDLPALAQADALAKELPKTEIAASKAATLRAILKDVRDSLDNALKLLDDAAPASAESLKPEPKLVFSPPVRTDDGALATVAGAVQEGDRVVEGVFDGMGMVGDDGKSYIVPPNYASKSKLVEGDMLKLTIGARGNFIYKQIGPIERQRIIGTLAYDQETGQYLVLAGGRSWKVLKASITYFKAEAGDEAVILAPKNAPSKWAAVENVIKKRLHAAPTP
jgi:hypothetical protein